jgi:hypothetical protein
LTYYGYSLEPLDFATFSFLIQTNFRFSTSKFSNFSTKKKRSEDKEMIGMF